MVQDHRLQIRAIRENAHTVTGSRQDYNSLMELIGGLPWHPRFLPHPCVANGTPDQGKSVLGRYRGSGLARRLPR
jgi:hypothetical protein